jgi:hypothetical protein
MGERASIAPGQTYTFWFTAFHETPGDFSVDFQMVREGVAWFPAAPVATVSISVIEPCEPSSATSSSPPSLYLDATGGVNWAINSLVADYPPDASILFAEGTGPAGNGCTGTYYLFDTMLFSYGVAQRINEGPLGVVATIDPFAGDELTVKASEVSSESFDIIANPVTEANCVRRAYLGTWTPAWP